WAARQWAARPADLPRIVCFLPYLSRSTMSTITVRQATLSDLDALVPLFDAYRQFYGRASDTDAVRDFLLARANHGESVLCIAFDAIQPVGFLQLYPSFSSISLARTFVLIDLYICESARRKG